MRALPLPEGVEESFALTAWALSRAERALRNKPDMFSARQKLSELARTYQILAEKARS